MEGVTCRAFGRTTILSGSLLDSQPFVVQVDGKCCDVIASTFSILYCKLFQAGSTLHFGRGRRRIGLVSHSEYRSDAEDTFPTLPVHRGLTQRRHVQQRQRPLQNKVRRRNVNSLKNRTYSEEVTSSNVDSSWRTLSISIELSLK